jgi:hypothetical protein
MSIGGALPFFKNGVTNTVRSLTKSTAVLAWIEVQATTGNAWIQVFDALPGDVTLGTTEPTLSFFIPGGGAGDKQQFWPTRFETAISYAATSTVAGAAAPPGNVVFQGGYTG